MAWTSPRTWAIGDLVTAALLNTHLRDNLKAMSQWTTYTPTWTALSGGTPSLGNGTLAGKYVTFGNMCHVKVRLDIGSTTSVGSTAGWKFSLPVNAAGTHDSLSAALGNGLISYCGSAGIADPTYVLIVTHDSYVGASSPFAAPWAAGGHVHFSGTYEI